jgi:hypothetical protein
MLEGRFEVAHVILWFALRVMIKGQRHTPMQPSMGPPTALSKQDVPWLHNQALKSSSSVPRTSLLPLSLSRGLAWHHSKPALSDPQMMRVSPMARGPRRRLKPVTHRQVRATSRAARHPASAPLVVLSRLAVLFEQLSTISSQIFVRPFPLTCTSQHTV